MPVSYEESTKDENVNHVLSRIFMQRSGKICVYLPVCTRNSYAKKYSHCFCVGKTINAWDSTGIIFAAGVYSSGSPLRIARIHKEAV